MFTLFFYQKIILQITLKHYRYFVDVEELILVFINRIFDLMV